MHQPHLAQPLAHHEDRPHPVVACAAVLDGALKDVAAVEPGFMSVGEKQAALTALAAVRSQLDALSARVLAAAGEVAEAHGLRDVAAWPAVQTRATQREARRDLALGRALERHPWVAAALTSGGLRTEQARVIAEAVDALASHVGTDTRDDHPWSRGGPTDLTNARLLCPRHHRLAHDSQYAKTIHADKKVTFTRRT